MKGAETRIVTLRRHHESTGPVRRIGPFPDYAGGFVLMSLCYVLLRWIFEFAAVRARSREFTIFTDLSAALGLQETSKIT